MLEDDKPEASGIKTPSFAIPYAGLFRRVARTVETGLGVAAMLGLNKPTSVVAPTLTTINPVGSFAYGKGIDLIKKYTMDPEASISTEPIVGGISYDEMDLQYVVGTPMLTSSFAMVEGTPATVVGTTSPYALMGQYTYVDFVARNFRYISGSYKFKAYITASQMHSVRVVFFLSILGTSDWQDCYHRVVDIQGDTEAEFTMPYCNTEVVREINSETVYFKIWVKILAWSQPTPAVSNPIWMNVYKSGASDFRVGGMKEQEFTTTSNPRQDFA